MSSNPREELDLPARFNQWPQQERVDYFRLAKTRDDLLACLILEATGEPRQRETDRLDKGEAAAALETMLRRRGV